MNQRLQKRLFFVFLLAVMVACISCFAVLQVFSAKADDEDVNLYATVYLDKDDISGENNKIYSYNDCSTGWGKAVELAKEAAALDSVNPDYYVKVVLKKNWVASSDYGFLLNSSDQAFSSGRILVPADTKITIDLNGYTIDRNLQSGAGNGQVIIVKGTLTVVDSSTNVWTDETGGKITGGYNASSSGYAYGSGVYVMGGTFNLEGGSILNNNISGKAIGIGVCVAGDGENVGSFNMYGGRISGHKNAVGNATYGGGVGVCGSNSMFTMYGGVIENNEATIGGGICSYNSNDASININGGTVRNNKAVKTANDSLSDSKEVGGGGVGSYKSGNISLQAGEISGNFSDSNGGGIYIASAEELSVNLFISGTIKIVNNVVASLTRNVYGGGIALSVLGTAQTELNAEISTGEIKNNYAVANCESSDTYTAAGGGIYLHGASARMYFAEIIGNRALSIKSASSGDFETVCQALMAGNESSVESLVCDGVKTCGGGVYVEDATDNGNVDALFAMIGGNIKGNRAALGGGVNLNGSMNFSGGSITENKANEGGGLYLANDADLALSGSIVIEDNKTIAGAASNLQLKSNGCIPKIDGNFFDVDEDNNGTRIHLSIDSGVGNGTAITHGYGNNNRTFVSYDGSYEPKYEGEYGVGDPTNGIWAYANPYRYFYVDGTGETQHLLVNTDGELVVADKEVTFTVVYNASSADVEESSTFGKAYQQKENMPLWNYVTWQYGSTDKTPKSLKSGDSSVNIETKAKAYKLVADNMAYYVVVQPKVLSNNDVEIELQQKVFDYSGDQHKPAIKSVRLNNAINGTSDLTSEDYYVDEANGYLDNVNAGKATVIVTFKGNFAGEAYAYFDINGSSADVNMTVSWEYKYGDIWRAITDPENTFAFTGENQSDKIRAKLEYNVASSTESKYVYAYGVEGEDQITTMTLRFNDDSQESSEYNDFTSMGDYVVTIYGVFNYNVDNGDRRFEVTMQPQVLEFTADAFSFKDDANNPLWLLQVDDQLTTLLDGATYWDPDAKLNEYGEPVVTEERNGGFARFRDKELTIVLNDNYRLGRTPLSELLSKASGATYSTVGDNKGSLNKVSVVTTTVVIVFNTSFKISGADSANYEVDSGAGFLTLKWTWKIVNISNGLRSESEGESVEDLGSDLGEWQFGEIPAIISKGFRPEHGNTVYYSFYNSGATEPFDSFAIVYSDDTSSARKNYYEVVGGEINFDKPINVDQYLLWYYYTLRAGDYKLVITVPTLEPSENEHRHWWDNNVSATDQGTRYYGFSHTFTFSVTANSLKDCVDAGILEIIFPDNTFIAYNGQANNFESVKPEVWLNGLVLLEEGRDYTLSSEDINVGPASITVTGMNSFAGSSVTFEGKFTIIQAENGWTSVPYIMHWSYEGFVNGINLIQATPYFSDGLYFKVASDAEGKNVLDGLGHITIGADGKFADSVAEALKGLKVGTYYLIGHVDGTDNYKELKSSAIRFEVFKANNSWTKTPSISSWTQGKFTEIKDYLIIDPTFGDAHIVICDAKGNVYYDNEQNINRLAGAKAGRYTLTASVVGDDNYYSLDDYTILFDVFAKAGLPWWSALLIAIGSLGIAALIIFILWKNGVFNIVTDKIMLAIRTRVSVEATIASVRAAKKMEEGRQSVEEAKRRERLEKARQALEAKRAMSPEERAAMLEAKAQADAEKAEKLRARSEASFKRVEKIRKNETQSATPESEAAISDDSDTPTEK